MDQDATWYEGRHRPRPHCVTCESSPPQKKVGTALNFQPVSIVAKRSPISATCTLIGYVAYTGNQMSLAVVGLIGLQSEKNYIVYGRPME